MLHSLAPRHRVSASKKDSAKCSIPLSSGVPRPAKPATDKSLLVIPLLWLKEGIIRPDITSNSKQFP
jgi:hypothetical protein